MNARVSSFAAKYFFLLVIVLAAGCGTRLYKVAPLPSAPPDFSAGASGGISAGAEALGGDRAMEQFEANLPLAGVIAVDVRLSNQTTNPIEMSRLRFELQDGGGAKLKPISSKKALGRVMKYYGNSFYTLEARRRTREDYQAVSLNVSSPLAPSEERRGLLFFETKRETAEVNGLTLSITGPSIAITLSASR